MFDFDDLEEDDPSQDTEASAREEAQRAADSLSDPAWNVRRKACKDLAEMGEVARPFLQYLKRLVDADDDFEVQKAARSALKDLRAAGVCIDFAKLRNTARQELARDLGLDVLADSVGFGGSSSSTMQPEEVVVDNDTNETISASIEEVTQVLTQSSQMRSMKHALADPGPVAKSSPAVWTHADVGQSSEVNVPYESCTVLEDIHSSSDTEDAGTRINYLERKLPMRDSTEIRMPDDVSWTGPRVNFQINLDVLPMRMERESMLPAEVADIWENHWGVQYARRLKFCAQTEYENKYLSPRVDSLASDPVIVKLEGAAGILCSLSNALRIYGGLLAHEVQLERERKAVKLANNPQRESTAPRPRHISESSYAAERSKGGLQFQIDMDSRDKQRMLERKLPSNDSSSMVRGATRKKHSFGVYAVPDFKSACKTGNPE